MQFFVQPVATAKSAFLQLHEQRVLPCNVSCNLSSNLSLEDEVKVEVVFLLDIVRQVARGVLLQKSVAALPQSLRKVELDSTSCNVCCNKNVARLDDCVTPCNFSCSCVATKLRDKLHKKLHSVTPPYMHYVLLFTILNHFKFISSSCCKFKLYVY